MLWLCAFAKKSPEYFIAFEKCWEFGNTKSDKIGGWQHRSFMHEWMEVSIKLPDNSLQQN